MEYRALGRTGMSVSTISFGAWAIGGSWGTVTTRSRCGHCTPRSTAASISSIPPTSMATAEASGWSPVCDASGRAISSTWRRRPAADCRCRRPRATHARTSSDGWIAACATWTSKPSICSSCTARRRRCSRTRRVYRHPRRARAGRQDSALRRQRRAHRRGPGSHRASGRRDGPDHLQHVPATARRGVLSGGGAPERRRPRPRAAGKRFADAASSAPNPPSRPTIIASSIATAKPSTRARRSRAFPTRSACRRSRSCGASVPAGQTLAQTRAAMDADVRRRHLRDSRRANARTGPRERGCGRPSRRSTVRTMDAVQPGLRPESSRTHAPSVVALTCALRPNCSRMVQ